ncbi:MAG: hypothetical protein DRH43_00765 [Deltaproteobacteria bacterium]|nr:MAG: hypothetical protein DRH43_00765 [Deltaproteobacteria bacterium]
MPKDYSPFTPGQPVPVEFFVGRLSEIEKLKQKSAITVKGKLQVAFLTGERGIGKSSLASFVRFIAEREQDVLSLHTFLGGVSSLEEMARRVFDRLLKESIGKSWENKVKGFFGNHIKQVGLFGISVEFGAPERDLRRIVHDFAPALRNLIEQLRDQKKAILLVLDDINGLASSIEFANWLKSLVDEIATARQPLPLFLLLVGLEERRQSLVSLQPSLARVFDVVEIQTWSKGETEEFFQRAFSQVGVSVKQEALSLLSRFAGGLPVLAHEIGDATFKVDKDDKIDEKDAVNGVIAAADIVGRKHLEPKVYQAIRSERYRSILRKIATMPFDIRFKRSDLPARLNAEEKKVLDNFLRRMRKLDVIRPDPDGGRGAYRFGNHLHYLYFWLEALRAKETRE